MPERPQPRGPSISVLGDPELLPRACSLLSTTRMAIQVKWFPTLIKRTKSKQAETEVAWREGLTAHAVFLAEGFNDADAEAVLVLINDAQADMADVLKDSDRLEFMVSIQGG